MGIFQLGLCKIYIGFGHDFVLFEKYVFVNVSQGLNLGFLALDFTIYFTAEFERNRGLVDKV